MGGSIVKLPQIGKILNSKSARGLSLSAYVCVPSAKPGCLLMDSFVDPRDRELCHHIGVRLPQ